MSRKKLIMGIVALFTALILASYGGKEETAPDDKKEINEESQQSEEESDSMGETGHSGMDNSCFGEVPENLTGAEEPPYPVGSEEVMHANHMEGMDGAVATIEVAHETTVYAVTYTPTSGGEKVENHKWVIHEEIKNAEEQPYEQGAEVELNADHMEGMNGATAKVDSVEDTTVYMVSYTDTETDEKVKN